MPLGVVDGTVGTRFVNMFQRAQMATQHLFHLTILAQAILFYKSGLNKSEVINLPKRHSLKQIRLSLLEVLRIYVVKLVNA